MSRPDPLCIYHITHADNLRSIVRDKALWSDVEMIRRGGPTSAVGMSSIKQRRLDLPVKCWNGLKVGQCVPFYFCPRSVMLYLLHKSNHVDLAYRGGQTPIVHLEADLTEVVNWAGAERVRWAFSLANAATSYTDFYGRLEDLDALNWDAIQSNDWRDPDVKEGKQAEFLVEGSFPLRLVQRIGVWDRAVETRVRTELASSAHKPRVEVMPSWYY
ncbi:MAG: DUF4433 domain-containing protein [Planctomycetota bacterium]